MISLTPRKSKEESTKFDTKLWSLLKSPITEESRGSNVSRQHSSPLPSTRETNDMALHRCRTLVEAQQAEISRLTKENLEMKTRKQKPRRSTASSVTSWASTISGAHVASNDGIDVSKTEIIRDALNCFDSLQRVHNKSAHKGSNWKRLFSHSSRALSPELIFFYAKYGRADKVLEAMKDNLLSFSEINQIVCPIHKLTALDVAEKYGQYEVVRVLLDLGAESCGTL